MESTINIFTLNCWGIPVISKNRKERIEAIAKYLLQSSHNIVCLQEVWSEKDYLYIKNKLSENLPYSHYFYSGVIGSGLCVFSKWMIQDVFFHQWPLNGYIHKIHHGDWFGGKGVGLCRIKCNNKLINVYCLHLHAEYHEDDIYIAHRVLQAYSTAEFVNLTTSPADVSILAGDLNTAPGDLSFRLISQLPALIDPGSLDHIRKNVDKVPGTCDNINNSYSDLKLAKSCPEGKRIDHILFHVNPSLKAKLNEHVARHYQPANLIKDRKHTKTQIRKPRKDRNTLKTSSVMKLGGIVNQEEQTKTTAINEAISTSEETIVSANENLSNHFSSETPNIFKEICNAHEDNLSNIKQISNSSVNKINNNTENNCTNTDVLYTSKDTVLNEKRTDIHKSLTRDSWILSNESSINETCLSAGNFSNNFTEVNIPPEITQSIL